MSSFTEKYKKLKQKDEEMRMNENEIDESQMDPDELKMQHEKMDYIFTTNIAKKIFDVFFTVAGYDFALSELVLKTKL